MFIMLYNVIFVDSIYSKNVALTVGSKICNRKLDPNPVEHHQLDPQTWSQKTKSAHIFILPIPKCSFVINFAVRTFIGGGVLILEGNLETVANVERKSYLKIKYLICDCSRSKQMP